MGWGALLLSPTTTGDVVARYHYDAWGRHRDPAEMEASANRFGFTGHCSTRKPSSTSRRRVLYDPEVARFTSQDSFLGSIDDPPSLHRYFYANANPPRFIDPTGHQSVYKSDAGRWLDDAIMTGWGFATAGVNRVGEGLAGAGITFARLTQNLQKPQHRIPGLEPLGMRDVEAVRGEMRYIGQTLANVRETGPAALDAMTELGPERSGGVVGTTTVDVVGTIEGTTSALRGGARALRAAPGELAEVSENLAGVFARRGAPEPVVVVEVGSMGPGSLSPGTGAGPAGAAATAEGSSIGRGQTIIHGDDGSLHIVGEHGQPLYGGGKWQPGAGLRDLEAQARLPGKLPGDHAGHLLPTRGGFEGPRHNLTPMAGREVNQGTYARLESFLGRMRRAGHGVEQEVIPVYTNNPLRADRFVVTYRIDDGHPVTVTVENPMSSAGARPQRPR